MNNYHLKIKNLFIVNYFIGMLFTVALNAQITNTVATPSLTKYSLAEKIYLQIDNTLYQAGETIWFKAIVSKSFDNSLSDISRILYVELIDFNENVVETKTLKLNQGISSGAFDLQESFKTGKYFLRAYTNWNRNFNEDFIFSQPIDVLNLQKNEAIHPIQNTTVTSGEAIELTADINPNTIDTDYKGKLKLYIKTDFAIDSVILKKDDNNLYKLKYQLPQQTKQAKISFKIEPKLKRFKLKPQLENTYSKTIVIDENYLDVQFFPEGGGLVDGILSTVGIKAVNYKGLGHKVSGVIKDNKGHVITTFTSNDLGMGTFKLIPETGTAYNAEIYEQKTLYTYPLPQVKSQGSVLSVVNLKNQINLSIQSTSNHLNFVRVKTVSRGITYHDFNLPLQNDKGIASIPKRSLPDGIIKISVYNTSNQIINERLYFNIREDKRLNISLVSNKQNYVQREKTSLKVQIDSLQLPETTSVSVLVLHKDEFNSVKQFKSNIWAHMLITSELRGFIEYPSSYFDVKNADRTLDLDALMLTQGWRTYKYNESPTSSYYRYKAETNLTLSGTIGAYFNPAKRPKKPLDLNLIVYDDPADIYKQEIDSSGRYYFDIDDIYRPKTDVFMQVVNKKGKPIDFTINLDKKWHPEINIEQEVNFELPEQIIASFSERVKAENKIQSEYENAYNGVALEEVKLRDYKLTPAREKSIEMHGEPQHVLDGKELEEVAPELNSGIYSVLRAMYPDLIQITQVPGLPPWLYARINKTNITLVLVDNIPVYIEDYRYIQDIPVEEVSSIDFVLKAKDVYRHVFQIFGTNNINFGPYIVSYLNIYTKSGGGLHGITKVEGARSHEISGFSEPRAFYAPTYENLSSQDWVVPDYRSVVHWAPEIQLDKDGSCTLEFYNDDRVGEVLVIVEAISKDGKIGYMEKTYSVNDAER